MNFPLITITLRLDLGKEWAFEMPTWNVLTLGVNRKCQRAFSSREELHGQGEIINFFFFKTGFSI